MATYRHSGTVCDKNGDPITGVSCKVTLIDPNTGDVLAIGYSNSSDGSWEAYVPRQFVLGVFSFEGTYGGDTNIAGAEFLSSGELVSSYTPPTIAVVAPSPFMQVQLTNVPLLDGDVDHEQVMLIQQTFLEGNLASQTIQITVEASIT